MGFIERIILLAYFPQFRSPNHSRFESLFLSLGKNEYFYNKNKKNNKSKTIFPEKIARNEDKRTSIVIKGIPKDMKKYKVRDLVEKFGNINYLYLAKGKNKNKNKLMAFINVINYKSIIPLFMNLRNLQIEKYGHLYNLKIMYSKAQGKQELKEFVKKNF